MVNRYEALMLSVPEITQDETKHIENELDKLVNKGKGKISSFERWGKFKLTYPVRRNEYGVYFLVRFETDSSSPLLKDLQSFFKVNLNDLIMRSVVTRLDPNQPVEYQRPKSLEETPTSRDMDSFLKENKMEGLIGKDKRSAKAVDIDIDELDEEQDDQ